MTRKPRTIIIEDEQTETAIPAPEIRTPKVVSGAVALTEAADDPFLAESLEVPPPPAPRRHGITLGKIFATGLSILASLAIGIWVDSLVRDLFTRLPWLGWVALGATALALFALLIFAWRELRGLSRLEKVADLRGDIEAAGTGISAREARKLVDRTATFVGNRPQTAKGRKAITELEKEIVDGPELIGFAERELLSPLDREARALTVGAARRVAVVTAVSPRAAVDLLYVLWEALRLVRAIAILYGGRPGTFGMIRLFRDVIAHLAVTGTVAAGDSILQQLVGHGLAAKLSARLGEGVVNGLMTARIGISAMDLCRPMPFKALKRPRVSEFFTDLTSLMTKKSRESVEN